MMSEDKYQLHIGHVQGLIIGENNISSFNFPEGGYFEQRRAQPLSLPLYYIPHRRNFLFTGRENLLQELRENLASSKSIALTQPQAIRGLGGIGKTQIALEYAYLYQHEYQVIIWINSSSEEMIISDLMQIAERLNLQMKDEHDQSLLVKRIKNWLESNPNWLLIFDNVESLLTINNILPSINIGHIILTTRIQAVGTVAHSIQVEKMNEDEALLFLLRRAKRIVNEISLNSIDQSDRANAKEIVGLLDSLPLALDQAGAYIEETCCSLSGYIERYRSQKLKLLKRRGNSPYYHPEPVTTTWSLSFEKIEQISPLAAEVLKFCSFLAPDAIPEEIITTGAAYLSPVFQSLTSDLLALDEAINVLRNYSLIHRNGNLKSITIHRLVQAVLKEDLNQSTQEQWVRGVTKVINHLFPHAYIDTWDKCQKYFPHARNCLIQIDQLKIVSLDAGILSKKMGKYSYDYSQFTEAEALFTQSLKIVNDYFGTENPLKMEISRELAKIYFQQEHFGKAESFLLNALDIAQEKLGLGHVKTILIISDLADLYVEKGDYVKAESFFNRFWKFLSNGRKHRNIELIHGVARLANFYCHRGQYTQAETIYRNTLAAVEQSFGADHLQTAQILDDMAEFYREQGKYDLAEPLYQRTLTILEKSFEPDHPRFANTINNLALLFYEKGDYDLAEPLFEDSYALTQKIYGSNHTRSATILNNLALLYRDQGKYNQAISFFSQAYKIHSMMSGTDSPACANTLNNLGGVYLKQGMFDIAEDLFAVALEVLKKTLGIGHPDTANVLGNLAVVLIRQENYDRAEKLFSLVLDIREDSFGEHSYLVAGSMVSLAYIYDRQEKYEKAISLYKGAIAIFERILGTEHSDIAPSLNNLAAIYMKQKKYNQAEIPLQRAITIQRKTNHPELIVSMSNLAQLYDKQDKHTLAAVANLEIISILEETPDCEPLTLLPFYEDLSKNYCFSEKYDRSEFFLRKALIIREQYLKLEKEAIAATLLNLGFVCERQGKYVQAEQFYGRALRKFRDTVKPNDPSLALASYHYDNIIKKTNNIATQSFKENSVLNNDKCAHQNTARSAQKSKKMKRKKQR